MSLESFCERFPVNHELRPMLERRKIDQGRSGRSLVGLLAGELVSEAGNGLREISGQINPSQSEVIVPDRKLIEKLSHKERERLFNHLAAVAFGVSVVSLEDTLIEKTFDATDWCNRYNLAISGSFIPKVEVKGLEVVEIQDDRWRSMVAFVKRDRTFAIFFKEGGSAMPTLLSKIIERSGALELIRRRVIPIYSPRASLLIG